MNRVRVVAISAVVLGVAVVAGTQFQKSQEIAALGEASQSVAQAPEPEVRAETSVASLVSVADSEPVNDVQVEARAADVAQDSAPQAQLSPPQASNTQDSNTPAAAPLTSASILPAVELAARDADAAETPRDTQAALNDDMGEGGDATDMASTDTALPVSEIDEDLSAELAACAVWLVVTPAEGAMLEASVYAPCDRNARVQVEHAGLTFDTQIDQDGQLMLMVPALIDDATLNVTFPDGRVQSDSTFVEELDQIERVALQWEGPATLLLHAYEFGAEFGANGHIHAGNPQEPNVEDHGFLTVLGDPDLADGHMVQVYSFPSGQSSRSGSVTLEIEAPVTAASCGRPLVAESIEMRGDAAARTRAIHLDMPDCDGTGGFVVLPGVLPPLQIAALR
ncbi:hypothetical protein [Pararhodobacter oceanensis]|uniref:hypothetical protein n=1 Tax=Pararhodobacter oceanensis TaxID=2172121 RepID=UPI003A94C848